VNYSEEMAVTADRVGKTQMALHGKLLAVGLRNWKRPETKMVF
jgi:hypothetical protein